MRARSVQEDKKSVSASVTEIDDASSEVFVPNKPMAAATIAVNKRPASASPATGASMARAYRSMLQIEQPPSLEPLNPISFDELYLAQSAEPMMIVEDDGANPIKTRS